LRDIAERAGVTWCPVPCIRDPRAPEQVTHHEIDRFRMLMIAAGYEDGNDADGLRHDPMLKLAIGRLAGRKIDSSLKARGAPVARRRAPDLAEREAAPRTDGQ